MLEFASLLKLKISICEYYLSTIIFCAIGVITGIATEPQPSPPLPPVYEHEQYGYGLRYYGGYEPPHRYSVHNREIPPRPFYHSNPTPPLVQVAIYNPPPTPSSPYRGPYYYNYVPTCTEPAPAEIQVTTKQPSLPPSTTKEPNTSSNPGPLFIVVKGRRKPKHPSLNSRRQNNIIKYLVQYQAQQQAITTTTTSVTTESPPPSPTTTTEPPISCHGYHNGLLFPPPAPYSHEFPSYLRYEQPVTPYLPRNFEQRGYPRHPLIPSHAIQQEEEHDVPDSIEYDQLPPPSPQHGHRPLSLDLHHQHVHPNRHLNP